MALTQAEINEVMQQLQPIIAKALNESTSIAQAQANIQQGVTQYIGARYVPIFADPIEWDSTRAYEPLTIVLYQGNSFTTRQYTPAGIEIANVEFWACTGNYNAQIEMYRREVKQLDSLVNETVIPKVNANTQSITVLNQGVANLNKEKSIVSVDNFTDIQAGLDACAGKYILYLPRKEYQVSNTLMIPSGTHLMGSGVFGTKLVFPDGVNGITDVLNADGYSSDIVLENISITNALESYTGDTKGIELTCCSYVLRNISVRHFKTGLLLNTLPVDRYTYVNHSGEVRVVDKFNVYDANRGIYSKLQDSLFSNIVIASVAEAGFYNEGGSSVTNMHIWAFKLYAILNGATLSCSNIEIESNPNTSQQNAAWIRQWSGRSQFVNLKLWNIQKPVGNIVYLTAGIMNIQGGLIYGCAPENTSKVLPPLCNINAADNQATMLYMQAILDSSYDTLTGNGYTNTGNANVLMLDISAPSNSAYTQSFINKTGGTYTVGATSV